MLVLTRKVGEEIIIGDNIRVVVTDIRRDKVRIGIAAPPEVTVDRQEVHDRKREFAEAVVAPAPTGGRSPTGDAHARN